MDLVVRVKVNSSLRVERSEKFEAAVRKMGCVLKVEEWRFQTEPDDAW